MPLSVKIKISYERPDELNRILQLLRPVISSVKMPKARNGKYRRAYVDLGDGK